LIWALLDESTSLNTFIEIDVGFRIVNCRLLHDVSRTVDTAMREIFSPASIDLFSCLLQIKRGVSIVIEIAKLEEICILIE
jgi:hypothetical protein